MSRILECRLNELNDEFKRYQDERQRHLEEAAYLEREMMRITQRKQELKKEYAVLDESEERNDKSSN